LGRYPDGMALNLEKIEEGWIKPDREEEWKRGGYRSSSCH